MSLQLLAFGIAEAGRRWQHAAELVHRSNTGGSNSSCEAAVIKAAVISQHQEEGVIARKADVQEFIGPAGTQVQVMDALGVQDIVLVLPFNAWSPVCPSLALNVAVSVDAI